MGSAYLYSSFGARSKHPWPGRGPPHIWSPCTASSFPYRQPLWCVSCASFSFLWILKNVYSSSPLDTVLWDPPMSFHVCVMCMHYVWELTVLQSPPGPQIFLLCTLPPCHFVPPWFYDGKSRLTCSLSSKKHTPLPCIKLISQNKSKEYKRFSSGFSNLSPLDKLLVWFNTIQTESIQKLFLCDQNGQSAFKMFSQH